MQTLILIEEEFRVVIPESDLTRRKLRHRAPARPADRRVPRPCGVPANERRWPAARPGAVQVADCFPARARLRSCGERDRERKSRNPCLNWSARPICQSSALRMRGSSKNFPARRPFAPRLADLPPYGMRPGYPTVGLPIDFGMRPVRPVRSDGTPLEVVDTAGVCANSKCVRSRRKESTLMRVSM